MKIFGIGLNKTGTKTLGECLKFLGCNHLNYNELACSLWVEGDLNGLQEIASAYDSFEDWPWGLVYAAMDQAFPGSRFILTTRISAEAWYESLCHHARKVGPTRIRKAAYGHYMPQGHKDEHIAFYERHNASVRAHFAGRPGALLEVCWERGDGWEQLCPFLGKEVPSRPFFCVNRRAAR